MVKYRVSVLLVVIALLAVVGGPAQAGGMWSTWLYNSETHQLVRVYVDGTTDTIELPLPEGAIIRGQPAVASAGNWIAYCQQQPNLKNTGTLVVNTIYDAAMAAGYGITFPVEVDLGPVVGCDVSPAAFNTMRDDQIAISVVHRLPDGSAADPFTDPLWELLIVDLRAQAIVERLNSGSPAIMPLSSIDPNLPYLPRVAAFEGDTVTFTLEPFASGGWFTAPTYRWSLGGLELLPAAKIGQPGCDLITLTDNSGQQMAEEIIWLDTDPAQMPADYVEDGPLPLNALRYQHTSAQERTEAIQLFALPAHLNAPCFVNRGRHIVIQVVTADSAYWLALDRAGTRLDLPVSHDASTLVHAPEGYAYLELNPETSGFRLHYHQFSDDATITDSVLWQDTIPGWQIVWTQPLSGTAGQAPFVPLNS